MYKEFISFLTHAGFWGWGIIIARFYDGFKYHKLSNAIRRAKTGEGHSRDFGNLALGVDVFMLGYFIFKNFDPYMVLSCVLCIIFVGDYWITLYKYYPYQTYPRRIRKVIKRPNLLVYFINSLQNDRTKKHL